MLTTRSNINKDRHNDKRMHLAHSYLCAHGVAGPQQIHLYVRARVSPHHTPTHTRSHAHNTHAHAYVQEPPPPALVHFVAFAGVLHVLGIVVGGTQR